MTYFIRLQNSLVNQANFERKKSSRNSRTFSAANKTGKRPSIIDVNQSRGREKKKLTMVDN